MRNPEKILSLHFKGSIQIVVNARWLRAARWGRDQRCAARPKSGSLISVVEVESRVFFFPFSLG